MTVLLCSGQGAQKPGMGADLLEIEEVADTFACASDVLGIDLVKLTTEGSDEEINDAFNAQALTMTVSVGIGRALVARGLQVDGFIGFSLGEISALALAEVLSLEDTYRLLKVRAQAMEKACKEHAGAMLALLGADEESACKLCTDCAEGDVLVPANFNSLVQIVISGDVAAIDRAEAAWKELGKRSARLKTAGAFHSPLMASAAAELGEFCKTLSFSEPKVPILCNTDAAPFKADEAAQRLEKQVKSSVLFCQSVQNFAAQGEARFIEAGVGGVLFNLVKRIDKSLDRSKVGTKEEFDALCETL